MENFTYSTELEHFTLETNSTGNPYPYAPTINATIMNHPVYVSNMTVAELEQLIRRIVREEMKGEA